MIKKIAAVMLSVCMSTTMAVGVQAADFTSGEEALDGMFTDGGADDQTGDISEIANDIVAQAEEKAQEYQKLKEEADRAAAKKQQKKKRERLKRSGWRTVRRLWTLPCSLREIHMYMAEQALPMAQIVQGL